MTNQRDQIYKYNSTKVDNGIKKINWIKIKDYDKSYAYEKSIKKMKSGFLNKYKYDNYSTNNSQNSQSSSETN